MAAADVVRVFMAVPCVFDRPPATASRLAMTACRSRRHELAPELALHIGADWVNLAGFSAHVDFSEKKTSADLKSAEVEVVTKHRPPGGASQQSRSFPAGSRIPRGLLL
jgi:hypothetical protein